jgi:sulfite exporter TauE/SafE
MTVLEQISNRYLALLSLGLLYGRTFFVSVCFPYIFNILIYNCGRKVAYVIAETIMRVLNNARAVALFRTNLLRRREITLIITGLSVVLN